MFLHFRNTISNLLFLFFTRQFSSLKAAPVRHPVADLCICTSPSIYHYFITAAAGNTSVNEAETSCGTESSFLICPIYMGIIHIKHWFKNIKRRFKNIKRRFMNIKRV